jgi:protein-S-isoprenylcysteine O-methyltransferase Ste14
VVVAIFCIQPFIGMHHHRQFIRTTKRTWASLVHLWLGRSLLVMGIVNAGLGLQLADNTTMAKDGICIAIACAVAIIYAGALAGWWTRRKRMIVASSESGGRLSTEEGLGDEVATVESKAISL